MMRLAIYSLLFTFAFMTSCDRGGRSFGSAASGGGGPLGGSSSDDGGASSGGQEGADECECAAADSEHCEAACEEGSCTVVAMDFDEDGFGDAACKEAPGDDCDDMDKDVHPGAEEVCDGKDNDCNEKVDLEDGLTTTQTALNTELTYEYHRTPAYSVESEKWMISMGNAASNFLTDGEFIGGIVTLPPATPAPLPSGDFYLVRHANSSITTGVAGPELQCNDCWDASAVDDVFISDNIYGAGHFVYTTYQADPLRQAVKAGSNSSLAATTLVPAVDDILRDGPTGAGDDELALISYKEKANDKYSLKAATVSFSPLAVEKLLTLRSPGATSTTWPKVAATKSHFLVGWGDGEDSSYSLVDREANIVCSGTILGTDGSYLYPAASEGQFAISYVKDGAVVVARVNSDCSQGPVTEVGQGTASMLRFSGADKGGFLVAWRGPENTLLIQRLGPLLCD